MNMRGVRAFGICRHGDEKDRIRLLSSCDSVGVPSMISGAARSVQGYGS